MIYSGPERRKYKRINHRFITSFRIYPKIESEQTPKWDIATIENLSASGMLFSYNKKLALGTVIEFKVTLPFIIEQTRCLGMVRRIEERASSKLYGIAIHFVEIKDNKKDAIDQAANGYYKKKGLSG